MKNTLGTQGEKIATDYLKKKGYQILERNYSNPAGRRLGEIDIIAKKDGALVFVEVKTRDLQKYSQTAPEENITHDKLCKLSKIANQYLYKHRLLDADYRFDAISVWIDEKNRIAKVKHLESIYL